MAFSRSLGVGVLALGFFASTAAAWRVDVAGTPPDARPFALAVDASGNVIAAGRTPGGATDSDGLVVKLRASDGAGRWLRAITGSRNDGNDVVRRLLVDALGNVYALGQIGNTVTGPDGLVTKLRAQDGQMLWRTEIDGGRRGADDVRTGLFTSNGDLVVAGASPIPNSGDVISIWRLAGADGEIDWERRLPGAGGKAEYMVAAGNAVYVAAHVPAAGGGMQIVIAKLDQANGAVTWSTVFKGSGHPGDQVTGLAMRGTSHVVVRAQLRGTTTAPDFVVAALATNLGNQVWRKTFDGGAIDDADRDVPRALAVDQQGNVVVAGVLSDVATGDDVAVVKLRGNDGLELWRRVVDGAASGSDDVRDLAVDAAGNVVVVGRLRNPGTRGDLAALKIDGASGTVLWEHYEDGAESASDTAFYVAIDPGGEIAVAGRLRNGDTANGFSVFRLAGVNGGSLPCGNGLPDPGEACDDANPVRGDGCRSDCTLEICGDARLDPQEECDAGPAGDACCQPDCHGRPDDLTCNDGDPCTKGDHCAGGVCVGAEEDTCPVAVCVVTTCDPLSGTCTDVVQEDGSPCDDGDTCTSSDRCAGGLCTPGRRTFCDDEDPCTRDTCDEDEGCYSTPVDGFESVLCVLERRGIQAACRDPLPPRLNAKLDRAVDLLYLADTQPRPDLARFVLKRAVAATKRVRRVTRKELRRAHLPFPCARAVVDTMDDLRYRIDALRGALALAQSER
jgi:cysteine-rich repeat protein